RIMAAPSPMRRRASPRSRAPHTKGTRNGCLSMWYRSSAGVSTSLSSMKSTPRAGRIWASTKFPMRHFAMTGMRTASLMRTITSGSAMRATPPAARISAGTRSRAMTATAPASSAMRACSGVVTSMMTPPLNPSATLRLASTVVVPASCISVASHHRLCPNKNPGEAMLSGATIRRTGRRLTAAPVHGLRPTRLYGRLRNLTGIQRWGGWARPLPPAACGPEAGHYHRSGIGSRAPSPCPEGSCEVVVLSIFPTAASVKGEFGSGRGRACRTKGAPPPRRPGAWNGGASRSHRHCIVLDPVFAVPLPPLPRLLHLLDHRRHVDVKLLEQGLEVIGPHGHDGSPRTREGLDELGILEGLQDRFLQDAHPLHGGAGGRHDTVEAHRLHVIAQLDVGGGVGQLGQPLPGA